MKKFLTNLTQNQIHGKSAMEKLLGTKRRDELARAYKDYEEAFLYLRNLEKMEGIKNQFKPSFFFRFWQRITKGYYSEKNFFLYVLEGCYNEKEAMKRVESARVAKKEKEDERKERVGKIRP